VDLPLLIVLEGLIFTVLFGGLSWLRREGLSIQFAGEALLLTGIATMLVWQASLAIHPILFLLILYLVTFRVRLLVDIANLFAQRGHFERAGRFYKLAASFWPDQAGKLIVQVNQATSQLQQGSLDEAISGFKIILEHKGHSFLGIKYEVAAHYNLGVAYRRKKLDSLAIAEFNAVLDTWPASEYARQANRALEQVRKKEKVPPSENN